MQGPPSSCGIVKWVEFDSVFLLPESPATGVPIHERSLPIAGARVRRVPPQEIVKPTGTGVFCYGSQQGSAWDDRIPSSLSKTHRPSPARRERRSCSTPSERLFFHRPPPVHLWRVKKVCLVRM
ncbi:hypothetical protein NDU88_002788 [Pleurodeles waltl]|uniref:Uncharacterized protein n=1 Tax=Pleurodeles waltl TaxID=8319 RepID=A0AAV7NMY7_PLEWA|nr:hypothetical protein NDU88_002788 [Pleurodeles waltl]